MGWIGVDLDGTLADMSKPPALGNIGPPVPKMLARVKNWLKNGKDVRIMTARVAQGPEQVPMIQDWLLKYVGQTLMVTCAKDYNMEALWDDLAVQVVTNKGERADGSEWFTPEGWYDTLQ